jgi:hypothetical protein
MNAERLRFAPLIRVSSEPQKRRARVLTFKESLSSVQLKP